MICENDRASWPIRTMGLHDPPPRDARPTPEECLAMMWQLADDAWAFKGRTDAEAAVQGRPLRVVRRPG